MMIQKMGAREARNNFSDLLGRVGYGGEMVIVERSGKALAAIVPIEVFERLMAEREERFQVIERIRAGVPEVPEEEIQREVNEAIQKARNEHAAGRA